jgi:hypothetical protein
MVVHPSNRTGIELSCQGSLETHECLICALMPASLAGGTALVPVFGRRSALAGA